MSGLGIWCKHSISLGNNFITEVNNINIASLLNTKYERSGDQFQLYAYSIIL